MASRRDTLPRAPGPPHSVPGPWHSEPLPPSSTEASTPACPAARTASLSASQAWLALLSVCVCGTRGHRWTLYIEGSLRDGHNEGVCATQSQTARVGSSEPPEGMGASSEPAPWTRVAAPHWSPSPLTCPALTSQASGCLTLNIHFRDPMSLIRSHCWKVLFIVQPRSFCQSSFLHPCTGPCPQQGKRRGSREQVQRWVGTWGTAVVTPGCQSLEQPEDRRPI